MSRSGNVAVQEPPGLLRRVLRDALFGIQDGLISTLGALLGIAEGTRDGRLVVLAGAVVVAVAGAAAGVGYGMGHLVRVS